MRSYEVRHKLHKDTKTLIVFPGNCGDRRLIDWFKKNRDELVHVPLPQWELKPYKVALIHRPWQDRVVRGIVSWLGIHGDVTVDSVQDNWYRVTDAWKELTQKHTTLRSADEWVPLKWVDEVIDVDNLDEFIGRFHNTVPPTVELESNTDVIQYIHELISDNQWYELSRLQYAAESKL